MDTWIYLLLVTSMAICSTNAIFSKYNKGGGYSKGYNQSPILVRKPVLVNKPVVIQQPHVEYQEYYFQPPPPPRPPPIWVKKPIITQKKQWQLVTVPHVTYEKVLVHPTPQHYQQGNKWENFLGKFRKW